LLERANEVASAQREGLIHARAATTRKADLRRAMLDVPITHLAEVGEVAASEEHELGKTFRFKPGASTLLAFRTAARGMASAAVVHQEVLARHGLSASVMEEFGRMLYQFDAAVALGNDGRTAHIGPRASSGRWRSRSCRRCGSWTAGTGSGSPRTSGCSARGSGPAGSWAGGGPVRPMGRLTPMVRPSRKVM